jgi:anti-anti-sigma factor
MEITTTHLGLTAELRLQGRVDTFWSAHLQEAVDYTVGQGARNIRLHLAGVDYLSSAGIRVVLAIFKQLHAAGGRLEIVHPSASARAILEMAGLQGLIQSGGEAVAETVAEAREVNTASAVFGIHDLGASTTLQCSLIGNPAGLRSGVFRGNDARNVMFPDSTFGLGLGAFGAGYEDCRGRHGEFLALAGAAAYQPTDGVEVPEYMVSESDWVPELNTLYALWGQGRFSRCLLFDSRPDPGVTPLSEILQTALSAVESDTAGVAIIAETSGLMGVELKRSVAGLKNLETPLSFREVRNTLSGAPKRLDRRALAVVVGVASLNPPRNLEPLFGAVAPGSHITGHFNAAVFPRRSLEEGLPDLRKTVQALFQSETLEKLMHLLPDDALTGLAAETHFLRGVCWAGPIEEITLAAG